VYHFRLLSRAAPGRLPDGSPTAGGPAPGLRAVHGRARRAATRADGAAAVRARPVASSRPRSECCQPGRCQRGSGHGAGPVTRPQLAALSPRGRRATGRESCV